MNYFRSTSFLYYYISIRSYHHDWVDKVILCSVHISRAQLIFCYVSLDDAMQEYLRFQERKSVLTKIDHLSQIDPAILYEDSSYLLEISFYFMRNDKLN